MPRVLPTFAEWLGLPDQQRRQVQADYRGEGKELVAEIAADFRAQYGQLARTRD